VTVSLTSPVTGAAQTGHSAPTFTIVADQAPNSFSKQWAVTANAGTQPFTAVHAASNPFTITFQRPSVIRQAPVPNPVTGAIGNSPRNVYSCLVRKGQTPVTGQNPQVGVLRCDFSVVSGADLVSPDDIRAALSLLIGSLSQQAAGLGDTLINNLL
jgi:hypothetical protein